MEITQTSTSNTMVTIIGRALKKYPYSKAILFVDFAYSEESLPQETRTSSSSSPSYTIGSIVIKKTDESEPFPSIVAGDVIKVTGYFQNAHEAFVDKTQRPSLYTSPQSVSTLEPWPVKEHGFFSFESNKFHPDAEHKDSEPMTSQSIKRLQHTPLPAFIIQCRHKLAQRVITMIQQKYCAHNNMILRESTTCYVKSSDRLILLTDHTDHPDHSAHLPETSTRHQDLILQIISDVVIGPTVLRIYPVAYTAALGHACHADLFTALHLLMHSLQTHSTQWYPDCLSVRLHTYPKSIAESIRLQYVFPPSCPAFAWNAQVYSHILSVAMIDGLFVTAFVKAEDTFIGDLREKKAVAGKAGGIPPSVPVSTIGTEDGDSEQKKSMDEIQEQHEKELQARLAAPPPFAKASLVPDTLLTDSSPSMLSICRASGKIEEAMIQNQWIYDNDDLSGRQCKHVYHIAVDIGASPGGWSYYLSQQVSVQRIISVDKGDLLPPTPWPSMIEHWRLSGEEALSLMQSQHTVPPSSSSSSTSTSASSPFSPAVVPKHSIDLFCCDANIAPILCIQFLFQCQSSELLAPETRFVITFKNIYTRKDDWERAQQTCLHQLERHGAVEMKVRHLLANTSKETTVMGKILYSANRSSLSSYLPVSPVGSPLPPVPTKTIESSGTEDNNGL